MCCNVNQSGVNHSYNQRQVSSSVVFVYSVHVRTPDTERLAQENQIYFMYLATSTPVDLALFGLLYTDNWNQYTVVDRCVVAWSCALSGTNGTSAMWLLYH